MRTKWLLVWNAYEIPDTESYTLYRDFSWVLGVLGRVNHFGVLCPLAVVGLVTTMDRWRRLWPLYLMMLALAGGVAAFYVFGRYRYPLVPVLALFAGHGAAELYRLIRGGNREPRRSRDFQQGAGNGKGIGDGARLNPKDHGDKPRGLLTAPGSLRRRGPLVVVLGLGAVATNLRINPERELDALAYANLGAVLGEQGNYDAATYCLEKAVNGAPDSVDAHFNLGMVYRLKGDRERALKEFLAVKGMDPERIEVDFQLGDAILHYRWALEIDPNDGQARARLDTLRAAQTPTPPRGE
jgi:hypothetical protein